MGQMDLMVIYLCLALGGGILHDLVSRTCQQGRHEQKKKSRGGLCMIAIVQPRQRLTTPAYLPLMHQFQINHGRCGQVEEGVEVQAIAFLSCKRVRMVLVGVRQWQRAKQLFLDQCSVGSKYKSKLRSLVLSKWRFYRDGWPPKGGRRAVTQVGQALDTEVPKKAKSPNVVTYTAQSTLYLEWICAAGSCIAGPMFG